MVYNGRLGRLSTQGDYSGTVIPKRKVHSDERKKKNKLWRDNLGNQKSNYGSVEELELTNKSAYWGEKRGILR